MASKFKQGGTSLDELDNIQLWNSTTFTDTVKYTLTPLYDEPTDIDYVKYNSGVLTDSNGKDKWGDICVETDYNIKNGNDQWIPLPLANQISCPILEYYDGKSAISDKLSSTTAIGTNDFSSTPLYIRANQNNLQVKKGENGSWATIKTGHTGFWFTLVGGGGGGGFFGWVSGPFVNWVKGGGGGGGGATIIGYIQLNSDQYIKVSTGKGGNAGKQTTDSLSTGFGTSGSPGAASEMWWYESTGGSTLSTLTANGGSGGTGIWKQDNNDLHGDGGVGGECNLSATIDSLVSYVFYPGGNGANGSSSNNTTEYPYGGKSGNNIKNYNLNGTAGTVDENTYLYNFNIFNNTRKVWYTSDNYKIGQGGSPTTSYSNDSSWQANGGGGGASLMGGFNDSAPCGYGYGGHGASTKQGSPGTPGTGGSGCFMMFV